jgi:hypothetical protein
MKTLARFVIRPADSQYSKGDLILGAMFKEQDTNLLKPNYVYEIREILDTLTIVNMGESAMGMYPIEAQLDSPLRGMVSHVGWCSEVSYILSVGGGQHLVTRTEMNNFRSVERSKVISNI